MASRMSCSCIQQSKIAHSHEPPVAVRARRRRGDLIPLRIGQIRQRLAAFGRCRAEIVEQVRGAGRTQLAHPALVHHADVVAHVLERRHIDVGLRGVDTLQHRLDADQVGDHVVHGPAGQRRRGLPLGVVELSRRARRYLSTPRRVLRGPSGLSSNVTGREGLLTRATVALAARRACAKCPAKAAWRRADTDARGKCSQPAAIIATATSASTMPTACQRVTRSRAPRSPAALWPPGTARSARRPATASTHAAPAASRRWPRVEHRGQQRQSQRHTPSAAPGWR